ncbi:MAG: hypothetical protein JNN30_18430 [Rhodanobacteraceae bacterium]|nr:hypothetical protein [Rhodanobacteraceae bacterium]
MRSLAVYPARTKHSASSTKRTGTRYVKARFSLLAQTLALLIASITQSDTTEAGGRPPTYQIDNGLPGPGRYEVIVAPGGGTAYAVPFPLDTQNSAYDLVTEFTPFVQLGPTGGARELNLFGDNTVQYIAQTSTVRSVGVITGPNGAINWVSESRIVPGTSRFENVVTFNSTAPFGSVRFISFLNASAVNRAVALAPVTSASFNLLNFSNDPSRSAGISHGIDQSRLTGASYSGWVLREATTVYSNIVNPTREVFSVPGVIDSLILTTPEPLFAYSTVYRIFQSDNEPASAFAVDLNAGANQATVVTYLTGWPRLPSDDILFRSGFQN